MSVRAETKYPNNRTDEQTCKGADQLSVVQGRDTLDVAGRSDAMVTGRREP